MLTAEKELTKPIIEAHSVVDESIHKDAFEGMTDDEVLNRLKANGFGTIRTYRDKTEDELHADYNAWLNDWFCIQIT